MSRQRLIFPVLFVLSQILVSCSPSTIQAATGTPTMQPTTPTSYPTPDLSTRPLVWFGPLPPMQERPSRPFIGAPDFMDLFHPEAPWEQAASHVQVFKLYGEWISGDATDAQLQQVFADLKRRGIAVDVDEGPLSATPECGSGVEGFAGINEGLHIAQRVKAAGGTINLIDMDEPFVNASIYSGPNACHWPAEKVAQGVYEYVKTMEKQFPGIIIGTSEPFLKGMKTEDLENYFEAYHQVSGAYFPFYHLDLDYTIPEWPQIAKELEAYCRARGIDFGIYYLGDWDATSDENWLAQAGERVKTYELKFGGKPDHVIFQSWTDHPDYSLPETKAYTYTNFVDQYFKDKSALGVRTSGPGANLAFGKKATASRFLEGFEPDRAVDANPETWWGAGEFPPQWIIVDLGAPYSIASINLMVSQSPAGRTVHQLQVKGPQADDPFINLYKFDDTTPDLDVLTYTPPAPLENIQFIRVVTVSSPSWVAWREIEVIAAK